jgi:response regulator RpfG family c-di-GMP phosphodiesterase
VAHILSLSGTQFDPDVVEAFKDESENFRAIAARLAD